MTPAAVQPRLSSLQSNALVIGIAGVALSVIGLFADARQFFISYLVGWLFWLGLTLGCLGLLMIHHLTGGRWGFVLRRPFEAAAMTLPLMTLLFIPICFGLHRLYQWKDPQAVAANHAMQHRSVYMNTPAFIIRAAVFFGFWILVVVLLNKWSFQQDSTTSAEPTRKLRTLSGPGIVLYPVLATFVLVDWVLSLEPDWFSTMFLVLIVIGQMLTAITFGIMLLAWLHGSEPLSGVVSSVQFYHLGML
ncbi:MAG TPA: hypothetical protein VG733_15390, partial [Chthoniobacteraceae bacterium]|nr:hypothetical protein [Chthoniobacteraceae bacterium]